MHLPTQDLHRAPVDRETVEVLLFAAACTSRHTMQRGARGLGGLGSGSRTCVEAAHEGAMIASQLAAHADTEPSLANYARLAVDSLLQSVTPQ